MSIKSTAAHQVAAGDGIRCWIVASRHGVLASAVLLNRQQSFDVAPLQVDAGDTVDFVVDFNANLNNDQFLWSVEISDAAAEVASAERRREVGTHLAISATPRPICLTRWEQFAQVLLLANELMFVD